MQICVYCSSSAAIDERYSQTARELGTLIGACGHALVYGGCDVGLMGEVARATKAAGGRVLGVIPQRIQARGLAYAGCDELLVTTSMAERKAAMEQRADAFVALPGGIGTLEELLQVLTLKQLGELQGAVVLLNTGDFYRHLLAHFEQLFQQQFAKRAFQALYHVTERPSAALDYIEQYRPSVLPSKWF